MVSLIVTLLLNVEEKLPPDMEFFFLKKKVKVTCGAVDEEGEVSLLLVLDDELLQPGRDHSPPAHSRVQ